MEKIRYRMVDTIKGLSCIAVVLIHFNFPDIMGVCFKPLCTFAVPYFFFVSGFFCTNNNNQLIRDNTRRKIKHVLRLICISVLSYAIFCIIWHLLINPNWDIWEYSISILTKEKLTKFLITNDPFVYSHLWFLTALLYCYLTMLPFHNRKPSHGFAIAAIILWIGFCLLGEWKYIFPIPSSIALYGSETRLYFFNCYLFRALPFFLFGILAKLHNEKIRRIFSKIPLFLFYFVIIIGLVIAVAETLNIGVVQFYMGTYLALASMCILSITHPQMGNRTLEFIGRKLSLYVYIFHIMIGRIIDLTANKIKIHTSSELISLSNTSTYLYSRPIIVLIVCLLISFIIYKATDLYLQHKSATVRLTH